MYFNPLRKSARAVAAIALTGVFALPGGAQEVDPLESKLNRLHELSPSVSVVEFKEMLESSAAQNGANLEDVADQAIREMEEARPDTPERVDSRSEDAKLDRLIELNPTVTKDQLVEMIQASAAEDGQAYEDALDQVLLEAEEGFENSTDGTVPVANFRLQDAAHPGDIYYTPATTFFVQHGHVGIYTEKGVVVEAVGGFSPSRPILARDITVTSGARQQYVKTSRDRRQMAVAKANGLVGRPYNFNFVNNRRETHALNCSQLVWVAYKYGAGIDIDRNGGKGVYPKDIRDSKHTVTYRRY